jgi:hypothetical protein
MNLAVAKPPAKQPTFSRRTSLQRRCNDRVVGGQPTPPIQLIAPVVKERDLYWSILMPLAIVVLLFAIAQIVTAGFPQLTGLGDPVNQRSEELRNALTPPGFAFSIWGVIFLTNLLLAIYQVMPGQWDKPEWRAARPWLILAFACTSVWQVIVPLYGLNLFSAAIIYLLAFASINAVRALQTGPDSALWRALTISPVALLAGWSIAAAVVGLPSALIFDGVAAKETFANGPVVFGFIAAALFLGLAGLHAARGATALAAAVIWGLMAVWIKNRDNPEWSSGEGLAILVGVGLIVAAWAVQKIAPAKD